MTLIVPQPTVLASSRHASETQPAAEAATNNIPLTEHGSQLEVIRRDNRAPPSLRLRETLRPSAPVERPQIGFTALYSGFLAMTGGVVFGALGGIIAGKSTGGDVHKAAVIGTCSGLGLAVVGLAGVAAHRYWLQPNWRAAQIADPV